MRYTNFDLWIDAKVGDRYPVRAASPLGEVRGFIIARSSSSNFRNPKTDWPSARSIRLGCIDFGCQLYKLVFAGDIELLFEQSVGAIPA